MMAYPLLVAHCCAAIALFASSARPSQAASGSEREETRLVLPGVQTQFALGGAGRFLLFHVKSKRQVVVVDVNKRRLAHAIDDVNDDVLLAAGRTKFVLAFPGQRLLQRYSFKKFKREKVARLPGKGAARQLHLGAVSDGPLLVAGEDALFVDLKTLKPLPVEGKVIGGAGRYGYHLRGSADGAIYGGIPTGYGPVSYTLMRFDGTATSLNSFGSTSFAVRRAWPNADGSLIFMLNGGAVYDGALRRISTGHLDGCSLFPTVDPRFFLAVRFVEQGTQVHVCTTADRRIVHTIVGLPEMAARGNTSERYSYARRLQEGRYVLHYVPEEKLLVTLPWDGKSVVIRELDVVKELRDAGIDYLFVTSVPPYLARRGELLEYTIAAVSKSAKVSFKLEDGPKGMKIDKNKGRLTWNVPADFAERSAGAIVRVRDKSGEELFHSFELTIR